MKAKESKIYGTYYFEDVALANKAVWCVRENEKAMLVGAMELAEQKPGREVYAMESVGYFSAEVDTKFHKTTRQIKQSAKKGKPTLPFDQAAEQHFTPPEKKPRNPRTPKAKEALCITCALVLNCDTLANLKANNTCKEYQIKETSTFTKE